MRCLLLVIAYIGLCLSLPAQQVSIDWVQYRYEQTCYVEMHGYFSTQGMASELDSIGHQVHLLECRVQISNELGTSVEDSYLMNFPAGGDSSVSETSSLFYDIKRYTLDPGVYEIRLGYRDYLGAQNSFTSLVDSVKIMAPEVMDMSDILLLQEYQANPEHPLSKNGMYMQSLRLNQCPDHVQRLVCYLEHYQLGEDGGMRYLQYGVADMESGTIKQSFKKIKGDLIEPIVLSLPIDDLGTGQYEYFVELRDENKQLIQRQTKTLQRTNSPAAAPQNLDLSSLFVADLEENEVWDGLKSLLPILPNKSHPTIQDLIDREELKSAQIFLYSFWRNVNQESPSAAYQGYKELTDKLDRDYGYGAIQGHESARGYLYLKYGAPDDIYPNDNEPDAPPYEIWVYHDFPRTGQQGVKFLFYAPNLNDRDFILLHSNANNETRNPNWQRILYGKTPGNIEGANYHDARQAGDGLGRFAVQMFEDL